MADRDIIGQGTSSSLLMKPSDQRHEATQIAAMKLKALDRGPTPEASQQTAMKLCDGNSETRLLQGDVTLLREFEKRWAEMGENEGEPPGRRSSRL